jgi:hypothetical protein
VIKLIRGRNRFRKFGLAIEVRCHTFDIESDSDPDTDSDPDRDPITGQASCIGIRLLYRSGFRGFGGVISCLVSTENSLKSVK